MKISIGVDTGAFETTLKGWELNQLPFATAKALTRTAQGAVPALKAAMQKAFDRPTPYTLNSTFILPATKTKLVATVQLKNVAQKGTPPSVFLAPQIFGGERQLKRSEFLLQRRGALPGGMLTVPGSGATLDRYGNMSRGQLVQVLSALGANTQTGFLANKSYRIGARKNLHTDGFFVGKPAGGRLPAGVYLRTKTGLKPILIFVNHAHYKPILPFYDVVGQVYGLNFQTIFNQALRDALILSPLLNAA